MEKKEEELSEPVSYQIISARKKTVDRIMQESVVRKKEAVRKGKRGFSSFLPAVSIAVVWLVLFVLFGRDDLMEWGLCPTLPILFLLTLGVAIAGADRVDRFTLNPATGYFMVAIVVYLVYKLVGVFAAGTLVDLLENGLFARYVTPFVARYSGDGFFKDLAGEMV